MKKYNLKINFVWLDKDDTRKFTIEVPENVTIKEIIKTLTQAHEYLDMEDSEGLYEIIGRNPTTLLDYICNKNKWKWKNFEFDIDMEF